MQQAVEVACPHCGAPTLVVIDPANGNAQEYVEDCAVCCRPNVVAVVLGPDGPRVSLRPE
ncbi:MAG: CPXCG motif-containing cysteine-rich protein [Gemmatimonadota bacterium]|nr:CPXCG motif-containing cysteine-rich protein [Gemmatimonadota bacterium]